MGRYSPHPVGDVDCGRRYNRRVSEQPQSVVYAENLTKRFGDFVAVDHIDFEVRYGESFGFLGPNGAGKTSTMKMIASSSPVTQGKLRVLGMDPATQSLEIKARLGVVPQTDNLDEELTVEENLQMYARYYNVPLETARRRTAELLEFVQLSDRAKDEVDPLSGGMKRRLTIARGLINEPALLLLDEPTTGLDPQARHLLWDRLYRLKQKGVTLVVTTHYMEEAEQLCDRLVIMDKARIVAEGTPKDLVARHATREVVELRFSEQARAGLNGRLDGIAERVEELPDKVLLYTADGEEALARLHSAGVTADSFFVRRASLEDVFLRITGRSLVE